MIGDLCKPLNPGENRTVRLTGCVPEMRVLDKELDKAFGKLRPFVCNDPVERPYVDDLRHIIKMALERENDIVRRTRRFKTPSKRYVCTFPTRGPRIVCGAPAVLFVRSPNLKHVDHFVRCAAHEHEDW